MTQNRDDLRAVANVLSNNGVQLDTYTLLTVAADIVTLIENARNENGDIALAAKDDHDALVRVALSMPLVIDYVAQTRKINAIKELRQETKCGLKAAKDAVESSEVALAALRLKLGVN